MKRASVDSHQSHFVDEEARARFKHQTLLQEYLELQKEFVSKKKKLQMMQQKKEILFAEVRFLRRRHTYISKIQSQRFEPEQDRTKLQKPYSRSRMLAKDRSYGVDEAVFKKPSLLQDLNPTLGDKEKDGGSKEKVVCEPLRVEKKPKNCLIKKAGKKKISWQDQVALKV